MLIDDIIKYLIAFERERFYVLRKWLQLKHNLTELEIATLFEVLEKNGLIRQEGEYIILNKDKLLELIAEKDKKELGIDMLYPT